MSEAVPSSSCVLPGNFTEADMVAQPGGMMLVNSPPDDVEEISRHLMSSLKQHNGQDTSSDSGDSLFITQKCVPQRRRRSSRRSNSRDSPEDEYDASTSEEEHPEDTKQKKKSCTTPKFTFDFLEERMTMLSYYQNRKLHYYAMGGYFRCAEQLWDGYQTGKDLLASLPTADEDGEPISPMSEEKDETTENEDIRVVEKKLFVVSKTKNSQPWYNPRKGSSEETQQNEEHYNAGREPQGRPGRVMHKISTWIEGAEGHQPDPSSNLIITEAVEAPRIEEKNKKNHEEQETWIPSLRGVSSSKTKESNEISEEMDSVEERLSTSGSLLAETEMEKNSRSPGKESRASDLIPEDNEQMLGNESDATCGGVSAEQSDREATDPHTGVDEHTGVQNSEIDCRIIKVKKRKKIKKEGEGDDKYVAEGKDQSLEGAGGHQTDPSSNLIITEAVEAPCMEKKKKKKNKKNHEEQETWIPSLRGVSSSKTKESSEISEEMDSVEERLSTSGSLLAETETGKNSRSPGKESRASGLIPEDNEQMLGNERDATCHGTIAEQSDREATDPHTGVDEHTGVQHSEIDCRIIKVKKRKKIKKEVEGDKYVEEGKDQSLEGAGDHQTDPSSNLIITEAVETPCMEKKKKKKKKNKREEETWIPSLRGASSSKTKKSNEVLEETKSVDERLSMSGANEQTGVQYKDIECRIIKVKKRKTINKEGEGDKYVEEGKDQSLEGAGGHQPDPSSNLIITEELEAPCMEKKKKKKKKKKRENQYLGQETDEQSEQSDQRKEDFVVMCENGNIVTDSLKTNKAVESATNDMHVPKNRKKKKKDSSDLDETTTDHPEAIDRSRNGEVFQEMLESSGFRRKKHKKKKSQSPNDIQTDVDLSNDVSTVPQNTDFVYKKKKHVNDQVGLAEEDESVEKTPKEKQNIEQETKKKKKKKIKDDISVSNSEDMLAYGDYSQLVRKNKKKRTHSVLSAEDEEPSPSAREGCAEKPEVSAGELAAKSADVSEHLQESKDGKKKRKRSATVPESEEKELEETSEAPVKNKEKRKRTKKLMETLESVEQSQTEEAVIVKKTKKRKSRREVLEKESH